ncbi:MAG: CDP-glycerol glycerophosphotransferase [Flavobacteriales bacterium]
MNYRFLIYISYSYSIPIGLPLEKEINKRGYTVKWFADEKETYSYFPKQISVLNNIKEVINYQPQIVLTATNMVPDFITGLKVQIFHGFNAQKRPSKKNEFSHFRIRGFFDLYCTQGPSTTKIFKEQQKKHPHFDVIETGWSKMDPLFPIKEHSKNKIPTILIASTFTPKLSLAHNEKVFQEIVKLSKTNNYQFFMVLHPKMDYSIKEKWKSLNSANFTYYDTVDLIPLYKKSDIMIADTTSAIQEFILQKKIVIAFNHIIKHNYLIHVNNAQVMESAIKKALEYPSELINNIKKFIIELHPYFDGESSKRIIDASIGFLHKDKNYLKNKPFNFIRKFKIRKKLNYYPLKSYNKPYTINE